MGIEYIQRKPLAKKQCKSRQLSKETQPTPLECNMQSFDSQYFNSYLVRQEKCCTVVACALPSQWTKVRFLLSESQT